LAPVVLDNKQNNMKDNVKPFSLVQNIFRRYVIFFQTTVVLFIGIVSYVNSLSVPMMFDDYLTLRSASVNITEPTNILSYIAKSRWVVDLSFNFNRYWHGEQVLGYHLINLALHLTSALLVYLFMYLAIISLKQSYNLSEDDGKKTFLLHFIPFTAAVLFICHPVQTQAVNYISQRYTLMTVFLYLCSLLSFLFARLIYEQKREYLHFLPFIIGFTIFALLAMHSKEIAFTIPIMIVLLGIGLFRGYFFKKISFIALLSGLILVIPLHQIFAQYARIPKNFISALHQATTESSLLSRGDYFLTQLRVVLTYIRLLILPINLNLDYDYPLYHSLFEPAVLASLVMHIVILCMATFLLMQSSRHLKTGNQAAGIIMRLSSIGVFWFYVALSVESSIIPIRDVIFEHRIYLPSIGFFMVTASCIAGIALFGIKYRIAAWGLVSILCLVFTLTTIARNKVWGDVLVMWLDVSNKSPNKARGKYNVGDLYFKRFMPTKALPYLVRSLELDSTWDQSWLTLNEAITMIVQYKDRSSNRPEYLKSYDSVNEIYRLQWKAASLNNLGLAYEFMNNLYLARSNFSKATTVDPSFDLAWYNLALASAYMNDKQTALTASSQLSKINPLLSQSVDEIIRARLF
jgi:tetratricopeptide (TPR) repeat protein